MKRNEAKVITSVELSEWAEGEGKKRKGREGKGREREEKKESAED